jgi:hypothetical protein
MCFLLEEVGCFASTCCQRRTCSSVNSRRQILTKKRRGSNCFNSHSPEVFNTDPVHHPTGQSQWHFHEKYNVSNYGKSLFGGKISGTVLYRRPIYKEILKPYQPVIVAIMAKASMLLKSYENKNCMLIIADNQRCSTAFPFPKVHQRLPFVGSRALQIF